MTCMTLNSSHTDSFGKHGRSLEKELRLVKELLQYVEVDPKIGKIWWTESTGQRICKGDEAGCLSKSGYHVIGFRRNYLKRHRVIFYYVHGYLPAMIDHKFGVESGDGIKNLQESDSQRNTQKRKKLSNNSSGFVGVSYNKARQKWVSSVRCAGKNHFLGYFDSPEEASECREMKAKELFGESYRGNYIPDQQSNHTN